MGDNLNEIDMACFAALREKIEASEDAAHPEFSAKLSWVSGMKSKIMVANNRILFADEPKEIAGEDSAPSPEDLLLAAVGSCHAAAWAAILTAKNIKLNSLEIDVRGRVNFRGTYLADGTPPGFEDLAIGIKIDAEASKEELRLILPEVVAVSTVPDTIRRAVPVKFNLL